MRSSVTVTKFGTVRIVAVGVWTCPVELKTHSRAALSRDFLIGYLIALSLGVSDQFAWFVVWRCWGSHFAIDETATRDPPAPIVPHCGMEHNRDSAISVHRCCPPAPRQIPGLRGTRLVADCRSDGFRLGCADAS